MVQNGSRGSVGNDTKKVIWDQVRKMSIVQTRQFGRKSAVLGFAFEMVIVNGRGD